MKRSSLYAVCLAALGLAVWAGCAPSLIPKEVRAGLSSGISFKEVIKEPDAFIGKRVLWGGQVASVQFTKEGVYLFISQMPVNGSGRPRASEATEGRFIAFADRPLDAAIYKEGTLISVVGVINGQRQLPMVGGFLDYVYPLVTAEHIYWWPKNK